jgi:hypothetical protein
MIRTVWTPTGMDIILDQQHISRITTRELRELVCQIFVFGPKDLREDIRKWLADEKLESIAEYLNPLPKKED